MHGREIQDSIHFLILAGVKSEIRSPGLNDTEVSSLSQDPSAFYGATVDISSVYDKDYPQAYSSAHQYYNRCGQTVNAVINIIDQFAI